MDAEGAAIVMKCLEKTPELRFQNFGDLRDALESWAASNGWSDVIPEPVTAAQLELGMTASDWQSRGYAFASLRRDEEAYQDYQRAFALDPDLVGIHTSIGSVLFRLGRVDEAMAHLRRETEIRPRLRNGWEALADGCAECGRLAEALEASRRASELSANAIGTQRHHAFIASRAGATEDYRRAVAAVESLLDSAPYDNPRSAAGEAIQFIRGMDLETGISLHQRSVEKYPQSPLVWHNFGVTLHHQGRLTAALEHISPKLLSSAIACYSRALDLDNGLIMTRISRGTIHRAVARPNWQGPIGTRRSRPIPSTCTRSSLKSCSVSTSAINQPNTWTKSIRSPALNTCCKCSLPSDGALAMLERAAPVGAVGTGARIVRVLAARV